MQTLIIQFRRLLLSLSDAFIYPLRLFRDLWRDPARGRAFLFGAPAVLIGLIALTAALVANGSQTRFLANYQQRLRESVENKEWSKAQIYAQKIVQLQPTSDEAKWELADILAQDDREESKEASQQKATALRLTLGPKDRPRFPKAHLWRANMILQSRNRSIPRSRLLKDARDQLEHALAVEPNNFDAKLVLAERILVPSGMLEEALGIYKELFEQYEAYYVKIAEMYVGLRRPDEAKPYLKQAVERYDARLKDDPNNATYLRRQASAYAMLGEHQTGIDILLSALANVQKESERQVLSASLSKIYLANAMTFAANADKVDSDREKFLDNVILAYQIDPESDAARTSLTRFGFSNFPEEQKLRALSVYDPRNNPDDAPDEALQVVGTQEVVRGDRDLGIRLLGEATKRNPDNHEALNNLAFTLYRNGSEPELKRALALANRAIRLRPRNFQYLDTRGSIYMALGQYAQAIRDLGEAVRGMPTKVSAYESLAICYEKQGMFSRAEDFRRKVQELGGAAAETDGEKGITNSNTGLPTETEQESNKLKPSDVDANTGGN